MVSNAALRAETPGNEYVRNLHQLPVSDRINFKNVLITYNLLAKITNYPILASSCQFINFAAHLYQLVDILLFRAAEPFRFFTSSLERHPKLH